MQATLVSQSSLPTEEYTVTEEIVFLSSEEAADIEIEELDGTTTTSATFSPLDPLAYYIFLIFCILSYFFEKHVMDISLSKIRHLYPEMEPIR
jgi:hypothetical protein